MKTCVNCGAEIEEKNNFCPHCGTRCESSKEIERSVLRPSQNTSESSTNASPMKWHNFLMVIMILGGIVTIANGINTMLGSEYLSNGLDSSKVYSAFPGLKSCDTFYGITMIAIGVFEFIVRSRLNQLRENGPSSLKTLYILSIAANLVYLAWASSTVNINLFNSSNVGSVLGTVLLLIINSIYYSKRSDLFVN